MLAFLRIVTAFIVMALLPMQALAGESSSTATLTVVVPPMPLAAEFASSCTLTVVATTDSAECVAKLVVADPTLEMTGWRVAIVASDVTCACGASVDPRDLSIHSITQLNVINGQEVDPLFGPKINSPSIRQSLDAPRVVLTTQPEYGNGAYSILLTVRLTAQPTTVPGTYTPTWKIILERQSQL